MGCSCEGCRSLGVSGLAHIGVFVSDMQRSLDFYTMLGFKCYFNAEIPKEHGETKLAFLRCGTCEIELIKTASYEARKDGMVDHIALRVFNIDAVTQMLRDKGVTFDTGEPAMIPVLFNNGIKNIFFRGPDGERLELVEVL